MEKKLNIKGMTCMHCSGRVTKHLESINGISNVRVDLENKEAVFSCEDTVDIDALLKDITELGYPAEEK